MKPINILLSIFLILSLSNNAFSQTTKFNMGIGYGTGAHLRTDGLSFVIGRYNETRSYLIDKMKEPKAFRGLDFAWEFYYPQGLMDVQWIQRKSSVFAGGKDNSGSIVRRDFKYYVNSFNFGFGKKLNKTKSGVKGSYVGLDFSLITVKNYTRVYATHEAEPKYKRISNELSLGFSPFLQVVGKRLTMKIYYQGMLAKVNYWDVNVNINPNTWSKDEYENNKGKTKSLGVLLRYNLIKNKD